ncbi:MAG: tRNA (N(6)-L-threonylcarbamoyladenosine(37)-C(2))-methylthiotransferase MtaB [Syntrophobacterales bacterium]|nr:MAG: tRNA (N(6)-L-threonylcarbamoyladenosine(37)-C(2))-methylthiotransferase MtaB [Syntrophobacterales bacterium]
MNETVAITTLGCKANQFDSEMMRTSLERSGFEVISFPQWADIHIVNTCTVTHRADYQSRQLIRRARRLSPSSLIVVTGCYAQAYPEDVQGVEGVGVILGNGEKASIADILRDPLDRSHAMVKVSDIDKERKIREADIDRSCRYTRALLKIQDGCNASCAYCIIPRARGRSRSLDPLRVIHQLQRLEKSGFKEVVMTGIHLGIYGADLFPPSSLVELCNKMETIPAPQRIRLSSIEPGDFCPKLIQSIASSSRVCHHLHIPMQSGDDDILRRMNRNYDGTFFADLVQTLIHRIPDLNIGVDVIVGFPGEGEKQFRKTYELLEKSDIGYLHVFPFSTRRGTAAYEFPHQVDSVSKKRRCESLRALGKRKRAAFQRRFLGRELEVLVEGKRDKLTGRLKGYSGNYIPVLIEGEDDLANQEIRVLATDLDDGRVLGRVVGDT